MTDIKSQYDKEQELLKLSEKDIQQRIDTACAKAGVRLLPPLPEKPVEPTTEKDLSVYSAGGRQFTDREEAQAVCTAINAAKTKVSTEYIGGAYKWGSPQYAKPDNDNISEVSTSMVFSLETADRVREDWKHYYALKDEYDEAKKDYDAVLEQRESIEEEIRGPVREAAKHERRRALLASEFRRYEEIADFDDSIAYKFIHDAYPDVAELFEGVTGLVNYARGLEVLAQDDKG